MKRKDEIAAFRELKRDGLEEKIYSLQEELMKLRFRHSTGQLQHTAQLGALRKSIARAQTMLRASANN